MMTLIVYLCFSYIWGYRTMRLEYLHMEHSKYNTDMRLFVALSPIMLPIKLAERMFKKGDYPYLS